MPTCFLEHACFLKFILFSVNSFLLMMLWLLLLRQETVMLAVLFYHKLPRVMLFDTA